MTRPASAEEGFGRTVISDIEGNGLLKEVSTIHCIVAIDVNTRECFSWRPWEVEEGLRFLENCEMVIGHNFIDYDARAIEKLHPWWKRPAIRDTLVMAKVVWPYDTLIGRDMELIKKGKLPPNRLKSHSLEAWGHRLGNFKGEYKGPWDTWSQEMHDYMIQDGWVNLDLYLRILQRIGWVDPKPEDYVWPELPFEIEHKVAVIIAEQELYGFPFDRDGAVALSADLQNQKAALEEKLVEHFGSWWAPLDDPRTGKRPAKDFKRKRAEFQDVTIPRLGKSGKALAPYVGPPIEEFSTEAPFTRIEYTTFSASSRDHLGQRLQAVYGWKPKKFGNNGKPTVDETTLSEIPESIMPPDVRKLILDFFVVNKTLGQLSVGNKAWLRLLGDDGRLHGRMDTCGAITSRGTHKDPNLGQVPAVSKNKKKQILKGLEGGFGWECRSLFIESLGEMTGTDASSLELLCLGHYLHPHDGGVFCERVSDPSRDPHEEHSHLTGETREDTKTVTYAYVYGAGPPKVGESLTITDEEIPELLAYKPLGNLLGFYKRIGGEDWVEPDEKTKARIAKGHRVIKAFENGIPGIKELKQAVTAIAQDRGWLKGLDGRKLYVRKPHAALNTLLQGAGAIICKLWMIKVHEKLKAQGLG
jgi:DNA polymerase-1